MRVPTTIRKMLIGLSHLAGECTNPVAGATRRRGGMCQPQATNDMLKGNNCTPLPLLCPSLPSRPHFPLSGPKMSIGIAQAAEKQAKSTATAPRYAVGVSSEIESCESFRVAAIALIPRNPERTGGARDVVAV